jgi:hypothetical protein
MINDIKTPALIPNVAVPDIFKCQMVAILNRFNDKDAKLNRDEITVEFNAPLSHGELLAAAFLRYAADADEVMDNLNLIVGDPSAPHRLAALDSLRGRETVYVIGSNFFL